MNVRIINTDEIKLLFQLFDYNDPDEMIAENTRDINKGKIDIFGLFQDGNLIGENHIAYVHSNERFAVTIKKNEAAVAVQIAEMIAISFTACLYFLIFSLLSISHTRISSK